MIRSMDTLFTPCILDNTMHACKGSTRLISGQWNTPRGRNKEPINIEFLFNSRATFSVISNRISAPSEKFQSTGVGLAVSRVSLTFNIKVKAGKAYHPCCQYSK